jgi:hypothetical protein
VKNELCFAYLWSLDNMAVLGALILKATAKIKIYGSRGRSDIVRNLNKKVTLDSMKAWKARPNARRKCRANLS